MSRDDGFASDWGAFGRLVRADWAANPRDAKSRLVLVAFRLAQRAMGSPAPGTRPVALLPVTAYRFWTEWCLGLELRPRTRVGGGLTIYHGFGIVVNDHAVLGERVTLRNGVTIGNRSPDGGSPVIGDDVVFGAGAIVIGDLRIGHAAKIGAGAVVVHPVPDGGTVIGPAARLIGEPVH
ncbi:serine acetyltransferase [uncultured Amnibacterium sp.]|uniref:serine acetyltransferase n=1 Tax=uncultured Amnibacterium sp. TaxID=1631851 RepID=UPI0035CA61B6